MTQKTEFDLAEAARALRDVLERRDDIWITSHESPDGDSIGAALALQHVLRRRGKRAVAIRQHPFPRQYESLPGAADMGDVRRLGDLFTPRVIVTVDIASFNRIGAVLEAIQPQTHVINIDHHPGGEGPGRPCVLLDLVDASYASTTMLTYELLNTAWPGSVDRVAAQSLYVGLITDTGCFRFSNTNTHTFRVASELAALGADPGTLAETYMFGRSPAALKLLAEVLGSLEFHAEGRVATLRLTRAMLARTAANMDETEGFVNYASSVDGVHVAVLLREVDGGGTRISLRSSDRFDVSAVAGAFGGGGHRNASGMSLEAGIDEAQRVVVDAVQKRLEP